MFHLEGLAGQDTRFLVRPRSPLGNELVGVEGEDCGRSSSIVPKESLLEEKGCASNIYHIPLYELSVLPLPSTNLLNFLRLLFSFWWGGKPPKYVVRSVTSTILRAVWVFFALRFVDIRFAFFTYTGCVCNQM